MHREEPREYTEEEVREMFLKRVWVLVDYWKEAHTELDVSVKEVLEGLAFSILAELDGEGIDLPGFAVVPMPNVDDKEYNRVRGDNWFPEYDFGGLEPCDIGGSLHELFHEVGRSRDEAQNHTR